MGKPVAGAAPPTPVLVSGLVAQAERALTILTEAAAAMLIAAEAVLLLTGVISRYVFHHPLVWSDELASFLFLWIAMLGSVIALQRG